MASLRHWSHGSRNAPAPPRTAHTTPQPRPRSAHFFVTSSSSAMAITRLTLRLAASREGGRPCFTITNRMDTVGTRVLRHLDRRAVSPCCCAVSEQRLTCADSVRKQLGLDVECFSSSSDTNASRYHSAFSRGATRAIPTLEESIVQGN